MRNDNHMGQHGLEAASSSPCLARYLGPGRPVIWGLEPRRQLRVFRAWTRALLFSLLRFRRMTTYRFGRRLIWISVELEPGVEKIFLADYQTYPANHFAWSMLACGHTTIESAHMTKHPERHDRWQIAKMADGRELRRAWPQPPCFFDADMHNIWLGGRYAQQTAFLICGGPSVTPEVLQRIRNCPGAVVMAINNSAQDIRPDLWIGLDEPKRFLNRVWLDPTIAKFTPLSYASSPLRVFADLTPADCANVTFLRRNDDFDPKAWYTEPTVNWGQEGSSTKRGGRSTMVAALRVLHILGFWRVYLVGADFRMTTGPGAYAHAQEASALAAKKNNSLFEYLNNVVFKALAPDGTMSGMEVFNTNPDSHLSVFPQQSLDTAIETTAKLLNSLSKETSHGLYDGHFEDQKPRSDDRRAKIDAYRSKLSASEVASAWRAYAEAKILVDSGQKIADDLSQLEDMLTPPRASCRPTAGPLTSTTHLRRPMTPTCRARRSTSSVMARAGRTTRTTTRTVLTSWSGSGSPSCSGPRADAPTSGSAIPHSMASTSTPP